MFTHAISKGPHVTAYLDDGRTCTWSVFDADQAGELAALINRGVMPAYPGDSRPGEFLGKPRRPPFRLVPRYGDDLEPGLLHPRFRTDLQPPVPADDWLRLRASSMAKEAAAFASGEQPDTGRRAAQDHYRDTHSWLDRAIRWLAGA